MKREFDLDTYSWILRGKQRRKVISAMNTEPKIPSQIKDDASLSLNNVSDVLRSFTKKKIVKCLNPNVKTGRLYVLTEKGKVIRDKLDEKPKSNKYY